MKSVISPDGAERLATGCGLAAAYALSTMYIYAAVYIVVDQPEQDARLVKVNRAR